MNIEEIRKKAIKKTENKIREKLSKKDALIIQTIKAIDLINKTTNLLTSRAEEWKEYVFNKKDLEILISFRLKLEQLKKECKLLEKYLEKQMKKEMPNTLAVCGATVGAKLLEAAGSLEQLSKMPASAIQILGAERAFFMHLKKNANPPKHGIIYIHESIRNSPRKNRGKIARKLAAKISIASKIDYFKGKFCGDTLSDEFKKEVLWINSKKIKNDKNK